RIAVADPSGKIYSRLKKNLSAEKILERAKKAAEDSVKNINPSQEAQLQRASEQLGGNFEFVEYNAAGKTVQQIKDELNARVSCKKLDAYLLIPNDVEKQNSKIELYSRKAGDFIVNSTLEDAVNSAVRSQRLADAGISEDRLNLLSRKVSFVKKSISETGKEKEDATSPWAGFIVALLIYVVLIVYGQSIMSAIVEEKETKISEILFSSARPFELLMGKLVGVGLAGLTQLSIWIASVLVLIGFGVASAVASGVEIQLPNITSSMIIYFFLFFLLGYFIYSTIYALIGSMVSNMQEGSQFALPPVLVLMLGLYFCFAVVRDPNSTMAFWVSIAPFFAPIVMPVRILAEMPPFWQIALAICINTLTIIGLTWIASRVYRVGMLMYGKRATIPEVWKWIWQS
ncbi:MAG: ABC transporter permease, partial [Acidobacteria bacterium]|nr:ABC transporter permease [Acidobacteriota bacterium]